MVIQIIQSLGYIALLYWAWPYIQHSFIAYALRCVGKWRLPPIYYRVLLARRFPADGVI